MEPFLNGKDYYNALKGNIEIHKYYLNKKRAEGYEEAKKAGLVGRPAKIEEMLILFECKLTSISGVDIVMAAKLLAEISDINRFPNPDRLASFAGIAPVKFSSAGKGKEKSSKQGNRKLHGIFYVLALQMIQTARGSGIPRNPVFYEYYPRKITEGKTKP